MIGLLVTLVVVTMLVLVVAKAELGTSKGTSKSQQVISQANAVVCQSDYAAVVSAVSTFKTINGQDPTSMSDLSSVQSQSVTNTGWTIGLDPNNPGQVTVASPGHPATDGDANC